MKRRAISILLTLLVCILLFTSVLAKTVELREDTAIADSYEAPAPKALRVTMKVCTEKMNYYRNESFEGAPLGTKKFGDVVYAEDAENGVFRIYNKTGNMLGYCSASSLVDQNARFFGEFAWKSDASTGKVSKLVDLRKYILIFDSSVKCDEDTCIAVQYDTALKLFRAAKEIYESYEYVLSVEAAHTREACSCGEDHSNGGALTLKITKKGESQSESIPVYENEGTPNQTIGKIAKILADNSLIRIAETDCFADADSSSYLPTVIDYSAITYSVWE